MKTKDLEKMRTILAKLFDCEHVMKSNKKHKIDDW